MSFDTKTYHVRLCHPRMMYDVWICLGHDIAHMFGKSNVVKRCIEEYCVLNAPQNWKLVGISYSENIKTTKHTKLGNKGIWH